VEKAFLQKNPNISAQKYVKSNLNQNRKMIIKNGLILKKKLILKQRRNQKIIEYYVDKGTKGDRATVTSETGFIIFPVCLVSSVKPKIN